MPSASLERAYLALMDRGGSVEHADEVARLRRTFEKRTGTFDAQDAWFEERSAAFWDDALVFGFARRVEGEVDPALRHHAAAIERSHRGLFRVIHRRGTILECLVTGAAFPIDPSPFPGLAEALPRADGLVQGFVCGAPSPRQVLLLPGAVFHAPDATRAIESLLERAGPVPKHELLDALLRMDRTLRAMPRAKPELAYRPEALGAPTMDR
jgi:hypothetical protein